MATNYGRGSHRHAITLTHPHRDWKVCHLRSIFPLQDEPPGMAVLLREYLQAVPSASGRLRMTLITPHFRVGHDLHLQFDINIWIDDPK